MAALIDAQRAVAACAERLAVCRLRARSTSFLHCRPLKRECLRLAPLARAAADAVADAPSASETDEQAAKRDDAIPDVDPSSLSMPSTDKYAVVEIGGIQMFVQEGRWYSCNRLEAEPGQNIQLGRVLALKENGKFNIGAPYLDSASVTAEVVDEMKGPKLTIFKMRRKKHYRKKTGHRQPLTQFLVTQIKL